MANEENKESKKNPNLNRLGMFQVSQKIWERPEFAEFLREIEFLPYEVQQRWELRGFEMRGVSPAFRELEQSEVTPEYIANITVNQKEGGEEVFTFELQEMVKSI